MNSTTTAETILVVDDNFALSELIEVILCSAGYHMLTAGSGAEALRLARNTPRIDLLVSDLEMPEMRGEEVAMHFARLHPEAHILFVSSSLGPIETTLPFQFLSKPFTVDGLRNSVRSALRAGPALAGVSHAA